MMKSGANQDWEETLSHPWETSKAPVSTGCMIRSGDEQDWEEKIAHLSGEARGKILNE